MSLRLALLLAPFLVIATAFSLVRTSGQDSSSEPASEETGALSVDFAYGSPVVSPEQSPQAVLTEADVTLATSLATNDERVREIIGDTTFSVSRLTLWGTDDGEKVGAVVKLVLTAPTTVEYMWPEIQVVDPEATVVPPDPTPSPSNDVTRLEDPAPPAPTAVATERYDYVEGQVHRIAISMTELWVRVDLRSSRVVEIVPSPLTQSITLPSPE